MRKRQLGITFMQGGEGQEEDTICRWCYEPADECTCRTCHRCFVVLPGECEDDECDDCASRPQR